MNKTYFNLIYMGGIIISYNIGFYTHKLYKTRCNGAMKNKQKLNYNIFELKEFNNNQIDSNYNFNNEIHNMKTVLNDLETKLQNIKKLTEDKWTL